MFTVHGVFECLTSDDELSLSLEVFGGQFDLAGLRQLHVSDGQSVITTCNPSFHLRRQKVFSLVIYFDLNLTFYQVMFD